MRYLGCCSWLGNPPGQALGVALDVAGGMVFMAGSMSEPDEDPDLYMAAFEIATGQVLWTWTHGTIYSDILTDLVFDEENGVIYACGYTRGDFSYALDADPAPEVKLQDMVVLALDPSTQETIWLKTYTSGPLVDRADFAFTITFDRNGVLHVGGTTRGTGFDTDGSAGEDDPDTRPRLLSSRGCNPSANSGSLYPGTHRSTFYSSTNRNSYYPGTHCSACYTSAYHSSFPSTHCIPLYPCTHCTPLHPSTNYNTRYSSANRSPFYPSTNFVAFFPATHCGSFYPITHHIARYSSANRSSFHRGTNFSAFCPATHRGPVYPNTHCSPFDPSTHYSGTNRSSCHPSTHYIACYSSANRSSFDPGTHCGAGTNGGSCYSSTDSGAGSSDVPPDICSCSDAFSHDKVAHTVARHAGPHSLSSHRTPDNGAHCTTLSGSRAPVPCPDAVTDIARHPGTYGPAGFSPFRCHGAPYNARSPTTNSASFRCHGAPDDVGFAAEAYPLALRPGPPDAVTHSSSEHCRDRRRGRR
ncbi:conserved unknown protein [Ectocarpus siliculosus]|uniref:Uncharacterized protein n=1 Tax=Ectocarpus siliculosus TaxID=2880 RepID=D7FTT8_ECTSI|nr:conserved unknown protein [Ectocarpus siliculosus]|eukprot:CBJ31465.1 conserved unknown protein [Ectocarpus siliculosus]